MALLQWNFPEIILSDNDVVTYLSREGLSGRAYCSISITEENFSALLRCKLKLGSLHIDVVESSKDRFMEVSALGRGGTSGAATAPLVKQEVVNLGSITTTYTPAALTSPSSLAAASTSLNPSAPVGSVSEQHILHLHGLASSTTAKEIYDFFKGYGIVRATLGSSDSSGSTGCAYFSSMAEAEIARKHKHRQFIGQHQVECFVEHSEGHRSYLTSDGDPLASKTSSSSSSSATTTTTTTPASMLDTGTKRMRESFVDQKASSDMHVSEREDTLLKSSWGTPTTVLFIKNLPRGCYAADINIIFKHLQGFQIARDAVINHACKSKPVVFAEFDNISNSKMAIIKMQGQAVFDHSNQSLEIVFARSGKIHHSISEQTDAILQDPRNGTSQSHKEVEVRKFSEPSLAQTLHKHRHIEEEDLNRNIHIPSDIREPRHEQHACASRDDCVARETTIHSRSSGVAASSGESTPRRISSIKLFDADQVVEATRSYLNDNRHTSVQSSVLLSRLGEHHALKETMAGASDVRPSLGQILKSKPDIFGFCGQAGTTAVFLIAKSFQKPNFSSPSGEKAAPVLYRSPSGRETRTRCRFDRLCKSGNNCKFGHEIIERAPSALKSKGLVTQDIRQSINSSATPNPTSLESLEYSRKEKIDRRNEAAAVETSLPANRTAEDTRIVVAKRQKTVVDLRSELETLRVPMS
jgi:hypothetical protein